MILEEVEIGRGCVVGWASVRNAGPSSPLSS